MSGAMRLSALHGLGGTALVAVMLQSLGPVSLLLTFGTLLFAEAISRFLVGTALNSGSSLSPSDAIGRVLFGWIVCCLILIAAFQFESLPFYRGQPFAGLNLLGLTLILALLKFAANAGGMITTLVAGRTLIGACALKLVLYIGGSGTDILLSCLVLSNLFLLFMAFLAARRKLTYKSDVSDRSAFGPSVSTADLFILPLVLSGPSALVYLSARCLAVLIFESLRHLGDAAMPTLGAAREQGNQMSFVTAAARLNLGFLFVGGGVALGVLAAGPYLALLMGQTEANVQSVLVWLVLGTCAPVIFGATDTLLAAVNKRCMADFLALVTLGLFCVAITATDAPGAVVIAKCFAGLQLLRVAVAAGMLAKFVGVWPGLTALLLRQIRLF